tara:strand:+ start:274 stop:489 length:216 start_codon:yes stop_codon:yes gene_type:complete
MVILIGAVSFGFIYYYPLELFWEFDYGGKLPVKQNLVPSKLKPIPVALFMIIETCLTSIYLLAWSQSKKWE